MSESKDSNFWLYLMVFIIMLNSCSHPNRAAVRNIVREECAAHQEEVGK
jgi:hypothetical protein